MMVIDAVAEALFCAIWESDEAWELATDCQKEDTRRWAQAAIDALLPRIITRVDVVDQNGVREFWGDRWDITVQDEGRTLKVLQRDGYGAVAKAIRDVALAKDIYGSAPWVEEQP